MRSSRAPTGSPETATRRTRSAPTAWPSSPAPTACRSTSPRRTSTIDASIESGREIPIEHRRGEEVAAGSGRGRRRLQPGLRRDAGRVRERDRHRARRAPAAVPVHLSAPDVRELYLRLARHGQEHLLRFWDELDDERAGAPGRGHRPDRPRPGRPAGGDAARTGRADRPRDDRGARGRAARRRGHARRAAARWRPARWRSCSSPAGRGPGSASTAPRGPTRSARSPPASLFQIHAEKIVALGRRHGRLGRRCTS